MGSIPVFHSQAAKEADERMRDLLTERDRAANFLEALDEMLGLDAEIEKSATRKAM